MPVTTGVSFIDAVDVFASRDHFLQGLVDLKQAVRVLQHADVAMYRAKAMGSSFELYDQEMHTEAVRRLELESHLRDAIEQLRNGGDVLPEKRLSDRAVAGEKRVPADPRLSTRRPFFSSSSAERSSKRSWTGSRIVFA